MQWQTLSCKMPLGTLPHLNFKCLIPLLLLGSSLLCGKLLNRENINILNNIFWFNSANCKATEMEKQFAIIKSAENETDFNNALDYVQVFLQLQSSVNQSLGKALDSLLGSAMTMSANML